MTIHNYIWRWEDAHVHGLDKPATQRQVRSALNAIDRHIGRYEINGGNMELCTAVQHLVQVLIDDGLAPSSIHATWSVLRRALNQALADELITRVPDPTLPKRKRKEQDYFTPPQLRLLAREKLLYAVLAETGMRIGEALALRPRDMDLANRYLHISESVYDGQRQEPKTESSVRTISLSTPLVARLAIPCAQLPAEAYIFRNPSPKERRTYPPIRPALGLTLPPELLPPLPTTALMALHRDLLAHQIVVPPRAQTQCGFHAFRRGIISWAISHGERGLGISEAIIGYRVGHRPSGITLGLYFQFELGADRDAAELIGQGLFK